MEERYQNVGGKDFARYFDHTLLKPEATPADIEQLCREAVDYGCYSVCVNSRYVPLAARVLRDLQSVEMTPVVVTSVVGFPLGAMSRAAKVFEAETAVRAGAHDIDMVIPTGAVKAGNLFAVEYEVSEVRAAIDAAAEATGWDAEKRPTLKVILETSLLTETEIGLASKAAVRGGANFLKTSTGFSSGGVMVRHLTLMREAAEGACWALAATRRLPLSQIPPVGLKASGGIRDLNTARIMIDAGATRLGTSATVQILEEYRNEP